MKYLLCIDLKLPGPYITILLPEEKIERDEFLNNLATQIEALREINWTRPQPLDEIKLEEYSPDKHISIHWDIDLNKYENPSIIADKIEKILGSR